jgi:hypothetical protein
MALFACQMKNSKGLAVVIALIMLASACGRLTGGTSPGDRIIGELVNTGLQTQTMVITKTGETYILELKNSRFPELNQKFPARFKDNVIHLDGAQMKFFYDPKADRISGNFGLGNAEFKRK